MRKRGDQGRLMSGNVGALLPLVRMAMAAVLAFAAFLCPRRPDHS
jgi:hypothetical protein